MVIKPSVEAVVVVALRRCGNKILKGRSAIRQRVQGHEGAADGVDSAVVDDAAGEGLLRERIDRPPKQALRKITGPLERRRHIGDAGNTFARASAFVVAEEK